VRELTKSITSFSWAMSLFGARQALTFLQQPIPNGDHPASRGFEAVARTAGSSMDGWMRGVFEAGDRLGRSTVDLMFTFVTLGNGDLGRVGRATDRAVRATGGALQAAVPGVGGCGERGDRYGTGGGYANPGGYGGPAAYGGPTGSGGAAGPGAAGGFRGATGSGAGGPGPAGGYGAGAPGGGGAAPGGWGPMPALPDVPELRGGDGGGCCG
jgi:hypothetical protein